MTYGFTHSGKKMADLHPEAGFVNTHIYVELIAPARSWSPSSHRSSR